MNIVNLEFIKVKKNIFLNVDIRIFSQLIRLTTKLSAQFFLLMSTGILRLDYSSIFFNK